MGFIYQAISNSLTQTLLCLLRIYRYFISPCLGNHCRFHPSCSEYAQQALMEYRLIPALWFVFRRILRCHPFHPGGYDPIPKHTTD